MTARLIEFLRISYAFDIMMMEAARALLHILSDTPLLAEEIYDLNRCMIPTTNHTCGNYPIGGVL